MRDYLAGVASAVLLGAVVAAAAANSQMEVQRYAILDMDGTPSILLDTETGRSWQYVWDRREDAPKYPVAWVPMQVVAGDTSVARFKP